MTTKPYYDQRISRKETPIHGLVALLVEQRFYPLTGQYANDPTLNHIKADELLYELDEGEEHPKTEVKQLQSVISGRNITHYTQIKKVYGNATFDGVTFHPLRYKRTRTDGYKGDAQLPQLSVANIARYRVGVNCASNTVFKLGDMVWWCIPEDSVERRTLFLSNEFVPSHKCEVHKGVLDHGLHEYYYRFYGWVSSTDAYSFEVALIHAGGISGRFTLPAFQQREVGDWIRNFFTSTCLISDRNADAVNPFIDTWFAGSGRRDFTRNNEFRYRFFNETGNINSVLSAWYERIRQADVYDDQDQGEHKIIKVDEESNTVILNITLTSTGEHEFHPVINLATFETMQHDIGIGFHGIVVQLQEMEERFNGSHASMNLRIHPEEIDPARQDPNEVRNRFEQGNFPRHFIPNGLVAASWEIDEEWFHAIARGLDGNRPLYDTLWDGMHQFRLALNALLMQINVAYPAGERTPEMNADVDVINNVIGFVEACQTALNDQIIPIGHEIMDSWTPAPDMRGEMVQAYDAMYDAHERLLIVENRNTIPLYAEYAVAIQRWIARRHQHYLRIRQFVRMVVTMFVRDWSRINETLAPVLLNFRNVFREHVPVAAALGNLPLVPLDTDLRVIYDDAGDNQNWTCVAREAHDQTGLDVLRVVSTISQYTAVRYIGMNLCVNLTFVSTGNANGVIAVEEKLAQARLNMIRKSCSHVDVSDVTVFEENGICVLRLIFQNSQSQNRILF